ncbi:MAG: hypothetical protein ACFCU3_06500 [Verrucomicrobiales bacterium]
MKRLTFGNYATVFAVVINAPCLAWAEDAVPSTREPEVLSALIEMIFEEEDKLRSGVTWSGVVKATSGFAVLPAEAVDAPFLEILEECLDEVLLAMNTPEAIAERPRRINELSGQFEDVIRVWLDTHPEVECDFAPTMSGGAQRSGYPDLRVVYNPTGRVYYLDPKVYALSSRASTFRTFYFEPRQATGKISEDAVHLLVGIAHEGEGREGWRFTQWNIVDLSGFRVRLKAEFQASNRDLYESGYQVKEKRVVQD